MPFEIGQRQKEKETLSNTKLLHNRTSRRRRRE
jgi:hypothetical protein